MQESDRQLREKRMEQAEAISAGKLPTNEQISHAIEGIVHDPELHGRAAELSPTGKTVLLDVTRMCDDASRLLAEKNRDEQLQEAISHAAKAGGLGAVTAPVAGLARLVSPAEVDAAREELSSGAQSFTTLVRMAIGDERFREFAFRLGDIIRLTVRKQVLRTDRGDVERLVTDPAETAAEVIKKKADTKGHTHPAPEDKEQRAELGRLLAEWLREMAARTEYRNAVAFFVERIDDWGRIMRERGGALVEEISTQTMLTAEQREEQRKAFEAAKSLFESWISPEYSVDPLLRSIHDLVLAVSHDEELSVFFGDVRQTLLSVAREPQAAAGDEFQNRVSDLADRGRTIVKSSPHRAIFKSISRELEYIRDKVAEDSSTNTVIADVRVLLNDLVLDEKGSPRFKPELVHDLQVIFPVVFKHLRYIPIPELDLSDEDMRLRLERVVINCGHLLPKHWTVNLRSEHVRGLTFNTIVLSARQMLADAFNVSFSYEKKTGIRFADSGKLDMMVYGRGMSIDLAIQPDVAKLLPGLEPNVPGPHVVHVRTARCRIESLKLRFRETGHDYLYSIFMPIVRSMVRSRIEAFVEDSLKQIVFTLDQTAGRYTPSPVVSNEPRQEWQSTAFE